jgi:hypothetical protein
VPTHGVVPKVIGLGVGQPGIVKTNAGGSLNEPSRRSAYGRGYEDVVRRNR